MLNYSELLARVDGPPGSTWHLFGEDDESGTVNLLTPERVQHAVGLVRRGVTFNLDFSLGAFHPNFGHRGTPTHTILETHEYHRDDRLDGLYLQGSSQLDGLRHVKHPTWGFYNGVEEDEMGVGSPTLGINRWAEKGIVGRGVLLDVERHLAGIGTPIDQVTPTTITRDDLVATAKAQAVAIRPGDIVMIRTGWARFVLDGLADGSIELEGQLPSPGLEQSHSILEWLWDNQIAVVAADNLAVEVFPPAKDSPFALEEELAEQTFHARMMHRILIPLLGMALGELWNLDDLAEDCAGDGIWECLVVAKPLNLIGGVGSPANAIALK